jgi:hypothetical protein
MTSTTVPTTASSSSLPPFAGNGPPKLDMEEVSKYILLIRQQPEKCRACGFGGDRVSKRPIDPCVIGQIAIVKKNGKIETR